MNKHRATQLWIPIKTRILKCIKLASSWNRPFEIIVGNVEFGEEIQIAECSWDCTREMII
uniref:Uncharacterized protein n=1 Tax=Arundo donax TaxID=35708 RepID=A0A0A8ZA08_ARUDO